MSTGFVQGQHLALASTVVLLLLTWLAFLLNAVLWMFRLGRYRGSSPQTDSKLRLILADFFIKLIDEFRNLLAILVILLFGFALFAAMWPGLANGKISDLKDGIQAVAAALGGLLGSIIGYYFGESAGRRMRQPPGLDGAPTSTSPVVQDSTGGAVEPLPEKPKIQLDAKMD